MQLQDTTDTTTLSYWLHWRVFLCAVLVLLPIVIALWIIWKREGYRHLTPEKGENQQDRNRIFRSDDTWKPCLKDIHPICLLVFRVLAFSLLLASLVAKILSNGVVMFFYYTQWTFTLVTIYFGCASMLSVYGCYQFQNSSSSTFNFSFAGTDAEQGSSTPLLNQEATNENRVISVWSYIVQVIFQMSAGAVMLTDAVYWCVIFPFLTIKDYNMSFMTVNMHTLNLLLLLGDAALNCLRIPWFRISFFVLYTGVFVIFQWILHAFIPIWWPYPFLDLSSHSAPLWYFVMALMHIPCYGLFLLIVEMKHYLLSRWFPSSQQC
ncbi:plant/MGF10-16 protein [Senna tora]|uniref:Plant/MGF10-16 protein n=1 Tax=Senna tora TaxID=362788 RepID=A0A834TL69_9FABA|nr:plant/MGF10-16 protein [Senna tora]